MISCIVHDSNDCWRLWRFIAHWRTVIVIGIVSASSGARRFFEARRPFANACQNSSEEKVWGKNEKLTGFCHSEGYCLEVRKAVPGLRNSRLVRMWRRVVSRARDVSGLFSCL